MCMKDLIRKILKEERTPLDLNNLRMDKLKKGVNFAYVGDEEVANFSVAGIGNVPNDPIYHFRDDNHGYTWDDKDDIVLKNSAYLQGGFAVKEEFRKMGIGEKIIKKIFELNPTIENVLLYAIEWQGAVEFWHKIGGESILHNPENGMHFIKLSR